MDQFLSRLLPSSNFSVADRAMTREQIVRFAFHTINVSCLFRCWSIRKWCNHRNLSDKYVYMTSRCQKENGHRVNLGDSESVSFLSRLRYKYITTHDIRTFFKEGVNISSTWHELFDFVNDIFILSFFERSCEATSEPVCSASVRGRTCCYCSDHITAMCHGPGRGAVRGWVHTAC